MIMYRVVILFLAFLQVHAGTNDFPSEFPNVL